MRKRQDADRAPQITGMMFELPKLGHNSETAVETYGIQRTSLHSLNMMLKRF